MLLIALVIATTLFPSARTGLDAASVKVADFGARLAMPIAAPQAPFFAAEARAVSNWRQEAGQSLRPASLALVARYATVEPAFVARCVRLNNYWCIKSARWTGEIGTDAEGHTGFATADAGADAAAQLLRRYYGEFDRRSALAIVRRWAPAECRLPGVASAQKGQVSTDLAPLGLRKTVRARYLARRTPVRAARRVAVGSAGPLRVQPWSARALMARPGKGVSRPRVRVADGLPETMTDPARPAPTPGLLVRPSVILAKPSVLMVRPSELLVKPPAAKRTIATKPIPRPTSKPPHTVILADRLAAESAALPSIAAGLPNIPLLDLRVPAPLCSNDETRIRNYAARIAAGVGLKVEDDLRLFDPEGRPLPNLAPVMLAMSAVELGTLRASPALVEAAIGRLVPGIATTIRAAVP